MFPSQNKLERFMTVAIIWFPSTCPLSQKHRTLYPESHLSHTAEIPYLPVSRIWHPLHRRPHGAIRFPSTNSGESVFIRSSHAKYIKQQLKQNQGRWKVFLSHATKDRYKHVLHGLKTCICIRWCDVKVFFLPICSLCYC